MLIINEKNLINLYNKVETIKKFLKIGKKIKYENWKNLPLNDNFPAFEILEKKENTMPKKYNYDRKEIFDYDKYIKFMESKKVRYGKNRTNTLLDFIDEETHATLLRKCALDLNKFDPTPPEIDKHLNFTTRILIELLDKYPNDKDVIEISREENIKERCSTNWYEKFGYKYDEQ